MFSQSTVRLKASSDDTDLPPKDAAGHRPSAAFPGCDEATVRRGRLLIEANRRVAARSTPGRRSTGLSARIPTTIPADAAKGGRMGEHAGAGHILFGMSPLWVATVL